MSGTTHAPNNTILSKAMDTLSDVGVGIKVRLLLVLLGLVPPLACLILLHNADPRQLNSVLAVYVGVFVILYYPLGRAIEDIMVLRQTRRINAFVEGVKSGRRTVDFPLPGHEAHEHDFLKLRRNIFWMVEGLRRREEQVRDTLAQLADAQRQILESIEYAGLIQRSFLPDREQLERVLGKHMLVWMPRDEVGGDTYWVRRVDDGFFVAVVDCTGHGVPGAFMTLIVNSLFEQVLDEQCKGDPARLLSRMNMAIKQALSQHGRSASSNDGLEGAVCHYDGRANVLHYAGARGWLYVADEDGVQEFKGDRVGVGFVHVPSEQRFRNRCLQLKGGESIYLATDGFTDQIGGPRRLPFGRSRLRRWLDAGSHLPIAEQAAPLLGAFDDYRGKEVQRDDVTVLGFKVERSEKVERSDVEPVI